MKHGKKSVGALAEIIHDDFVFNPHVGGITMGKSVAWQLQMATAGQRPKDRYIRMTKLALHIQ